MKKPLTIILAVAAIAAIIVSCVFGVQKADFRKTAEDLQAQLEAAKTEAEAIKSELEKQLNDAAEAAESAKAELEQQMTDAAAAADSELTGLRTELEGRVAALEAAKTELEQKLSETASSAETTETELKSRISGLEGQISELETAKAELESSLAEKEALLLKTERALAAARCNACLIYANSDWSVTNWGTTDSEDGRVKVTPANVIGEGEYTVGLEFAEASAGLKLGAVSIDRGEIIYPGCFIRINAIRVNGQPVAFSGGYTTSDDGKTTRMYLYREWNGEKQTEIRNYDGNTADVSAKIVEPEAFEAVKTVEVDFSVLTSPIDHGYIMFSNSDGSVQNRGITDSEDGSIKVEATEIRGAGNGYRTSLEFETPVKDMSLLALGIQHGEITFPGYGLAITRIWVNGVKIEGLQGVKGYTSSDDGIETRMNIYNEGAGDPPEDARSLSGDLTDAAAVWVNHADFEEVQRIEIEFSYRPVPVPQEKEELKDTESEEAAADSTEAAAESGEAGEQGGKTEPEDDEEESSDTEIQDSVTDEAPAGESA